MSFGSQNILVGSIFIRLQIDTCICNIYYIYRGCQKCIHILRKEKTVLKLFRRPFEIWNVQKQPTAKPQDLALCGWRVTCFTSEESSKTKAFTSGFTVFVNRNVRQPKRSSMETFEILYRSKYIPVTKDKYKSCVYIFGGTASIYKFTAINFLTL